MSEIEVRPAGPADADALTDLYWRCRQAAVPAIPPPVHSRSDTAAWMRDIVLVERRTWLAARAGRVLGMLVLDVPDWVDQLYVDPEVQGRGVGTRLLALGLSELGGRARLWCFESNVDARRFYERHGFVAVARTAGDNEEGAPDVLYVYRSRLPDMTEPPSPRG